MKVSVSFLKNNEGLEATLKKIDKSVADYIHVDVLDGLFANPVSVELSEITKFANLEKKLDIHLMTLNPTPYILAFSKFNNISCITIHAEIDEVLKNLSLIKLRGIKCGLAINPDTPVLKLKPYFHMLDNIIILGVNPGTSGGKASDIAFDKISELRKIREKYNYHYEITFDGGVNDTTINRLRGVDTVVAGSFVVLSNNMDERIRFLR